MNVYPVCVAGRLLAYVMALVAVTLFSLELGRALHAAFSPWFEATVLLYRTMFWYAIVASASLLFERWFFGMYPVAKASDDQWRERVRSRSP
ncbi:MAG: hypothetical protein AAF937_09405 [Planctomycetota bacterium]